LRAIDLHFHDLRREAGSHWLDAGLPLHRIQKWLGHANISQTSTYLMADSADDDEAMRRFDPSRGAVQPSATDSATGGLPPPRSAAIVVNGTTRILNKPSLTTIPIRFGTEGSKVQILSPRPLLLKSSAVSPSCSECIGRERHQTGCFERRMVLGGYS